MLSTDSHRNGSDFRCFNTTDQTRLIRRQLKRDRSEHDRTDHDSQNTARTQPEHNRSDHSTDQATVTGYEQHLNIATEQDVF